MLQDQSLPPSEGVPAADADAKRVVRKRRPRTGVAKGMRVRVYPTEEQARILGEWMGACRWTWNWALGQQTDHYTQTGKHLGTSALSRSLTQTMKEGVDPISGREIEWLRDVPRTSLTQVFNALKTSWTAFFDGCSGKRADKPGKPRFRAFRDQKKSVSFQVDPRHKSRLDLDRSEIQIPCLGPLKALFTEVVPGDLTAITVSRQGGRWFASLALVNVPENAARRMPSWEDLEAEFLHRTPDSRFRQFDDPMDLEGFAALDLSVRNGAVATSDGKTTYSLFSEADRKRRDAHLVRKKRHQRRFSRAMEHRKREAGIPKGEKLPKGTLLRQSKRQIKIAEKIARIDLKLANASKDRTHKFTTELVRNHHTITTETLNLTGMAKAMNTAFRRRFHEAAPGEIIRQLKYKSQWHDRTFIQVDRWFPSSKRCSNPQCHQKNPDLKLSERAWTCPHCSTVHHRDDNAAFNLWQEGQRLKAQLIEEATQALALTTAGSAVAARQVASDLDACAQAYALEAVGGGAQNNARLATGKPGKREAVLALPRQRERTEGRMDRTSVRVG